MGVALRYSRILSPSNRSDVAPLSGFHRAAFQAR